MCGRLIDVPEANRGWVFVEKGEKSPKTVNLRILVQTFDTKKPTAPNKA